MNKYEYLPESFNEYTVSHLIGTDASFGMRKIKHDKICGSDPRLLFHIMVIDA